MSTNGMYGGTVETPNDFEYLHLADIDPNFSPVDEAVYELKVIKLEPRVSKNTGTNYISGQFAITGDNKYTGRRLFDSFFSNDFHKRVLRRIADYTGVAQQPTESFDAWMKRISEVQPTFKVLVMKGPDVDYKTKEVKRDPTTGVDLVVNKISWRDLGPAG